MSLIFSTEFLLFVCGGRERNTKGNNKEKKEKTAQYLLF